MSDNFIRLIPTDVRWQPTHDAAAKAMAFVAEICTPADEITSEYFTDVAFIDSGVNTERADCPSCRQRIEMDWIFDAISARHPDLSDLNVTVPCCKAVVSLNELDYDWPVGFARFEISVMNANRSPYELTDLELEQLAGYLGHPVGQVLAHY